MSTLEDTDPVFIRAIERFKQGMCPCCGKGFGQSRGLEYRRGPEDIYCHTCKVSWPVELDPEVLRARLSMPESPTADARPFPMEIPMEMEQATLKGVGVATRLGRFFQRVVLRQ